MVRGYDRPYAYAKIEHAENARVSFFKKEYVSADTIGTVLVPWAGHF